MDVLTPNAVDTALTNILGISIPMTAFKEIPSGPDGPAHLETKVYCEGGLTHKQLQGIMALGKLSLKRSGAGITILLKSEI